MNKLVNCGCGGKPVVEKHQLYEEQIEDMFIVKCAKCDIQTSPEYKKEEAIEVWNKAMGERKGKWIDKKPHMYTRKVYCSECGCMAFSKVKSEGDIYNPRYTIEFAKSNFCPNCGADMRGEV